MNVGYGYSWLLSDADGTQVRSIVEKLRQYAIELGADYVSDVIELIGSEDRPTQSGASFTAAIPGATEGRYGLATEDNSSWIWTGSAIVSNIGIVGTFHRFAAELGIEVVEVFAGMILTSTKTSHGIDTVQNQIEFDWENF